GAEGSENSACRGLLEELIKIDLEYRWRRVGPGAHHPSSRPRLVPEERLPPPTGSALPLRPCLEDYARQFPELGPPECLSLVLIGAESRVRQRWGDRPSRVQYLKRFSKRGPKLLEVLGRIDAELDAESVGRRTLGGSGAGPGPPEPSSVRCPHCHHAIEVVADL